MARIAGWAALAWAVSACALVGCQPAKDIPDVVPKGAEPSDAPKVPTASDPAAKEYVAKAVAKFTGGKPELLAKGKVSRAVLKGNRQEGSQSLIDVTRTVAAVWPDRLADTDVMAAQGQNVTLTVYLRRPRMTPIRNGVEVSLPNLVEREHTFAADQTGQYWMALLLPLTDPKAIVYDLQSTSGPAPGTGALTPVHTLKLSLGDFPVYQLTFDAKTDLLLRAEYSLTELGVSHRYQWTVLGHKSGPDGQMLPAKTEYRQDGHLGEQFEVEKWEFPATIDDAEFSPPKK